RTWEGVYRRWRHAHAMHGEETVSRPEERELITQGWGTERALQIEEAGKPSKWITMQSLLVLKRLGLLSIKYWSVGKVHYILSFVFLESFLVYVFFLVSV